MAPIPPLFRFNRRSACRRQLKSNLFGVGGSSPLITTPADPWGGYHPILLRLQTWISQGPQRSTTRLLYSIKTDKNALV